MASTQLTLNQTTLLGATTGAIACLLLPITGKKLLLPNVTVAEVVNDSEIIAAPSGSPEWRLGSINWRGQMVPVVAFEGMNGQGQPRESQQVAILNGISAQRDLPFYGLVIQGMPQLAKVKIAQLEDLESAATGELEFLQVRYAGDLAVIPDLDALEACLRAA